MDLTGRSTPQRENQVEIAHQIVNTEENILAELLREAKDLCSECHRLIREKDLIGIEERAVDIRLKTVFWRGTIKRSKARLAESDEA
ncbi:hypothetical protein [Paenirhodobacter sp.]|uniref:hypothetical protein n=1 Tax=Paenirhodobacter sp. TaxID=1965326 RepID=UPI003B3D7DBA